MSDSPVLVSKSTAPNCLSYRASCLVQQVLYGLSYLPSSNVCLASQSDSQIPEAFVSEDPTADRDSEVLPPCLELGPSLPELC